MVIREEYLFEDLAEYLYSSNDLLIAGEPSNEERSCFFLKHWKQRHKDVLLLKRLETDKVTYRFLHNDIFSTSRSVDLCTGIVPILRHYRVDEKKIVLDMSSLDHVLIMFLTKQLITQVVPRTFFASYIRPKQYSQQTGTIGFSLCEKVLAVNSVPGFTKRESGNQTLCSFLGFEGVRLKNILESVHNIEKFIPVVAFPSGAPQWYNVTMWNSMDILQGESGDYAIRKCFSESVFEAVNLLQQNIYSEDKVVLAPLGTRPHSMACAIFACKHLNTRIIYDYVIESEHRAKDIANITIYHLSSFLNT